MHAAVEFQQLLGTWKKRNTTQQAKSKGVLVFGSPASQDQLLSPFLEEQGFAEAVSGDRKAGTARSLCDIQQPQGARRHEILAEATEASPEPHASYTIAHLPALSELNISFPVQHYSALRERWEPSVFKGSQRQGQLLV